MSFEVEEQNKLFRGGLVNCKQSITDYSESKSPYGRSSIMPILALAMTQISSHKFKQQK